MAQPIEPVALKVQLLRPEARLPWRGGAAASGLDLYACLGEGGALTLGPDPTLVSTGIAVEIGEGYDLQVRPRSGLSARGVLVAFGTVDADYRGELFVNMYTIGACGPYTIQHGERIAQLVVMALAPVVVEQVEALSATERGEGGFGSTGRR